MAFARLDRLAGVTEALAIDDVVARLRDRLDALPSAVAHRATFLATYLRTTEAVGAALRAGRFEDAGWVTAWDVIFAELYLDAHDADLAGDHVARPWRLAFGADEDLHPLFHLLLGMNAHINYDLPQATLAVLEPGEVDDPAVLARRERDHEVIDEVLAGRVRAEDVELGGRRRIRDRVFAPLNRLASRRFLSESRHRVWHNVLELDRARRAGPEAYAARLAELEVLSAAKVADLLRPGNVFLRLAIGGFGVTLPPV